MQTIDLSAVGAQALTPGRLNELLANAQDAEILLPAGRIDIYEADCVRRTLAVSNSNQTDALRIGVLLQGARRVRVVGRDTRIVCHGQFTPLALLDCEEVSVSGLSIDWAIPLTAEGEVVRVGGGSFDVRIDPERHPFAVRGGQLWFEDENGADECFGLVEYDAATGRVQPGSGDGIRVAQASQLGADTVRCSLKGAYCPREGSLLALRHAQRVHPGILIHGCRGIALESVRMYCCAGLGVLTQFSRDITLRALELTPNFAAGRRVAGCHDDGFHFSNVGGQVVVEDCATYALLDDPINVHGTALRVAGVLGPHCVQAEFMHPQSVNFDLWARPGDEIGIIDARTMHTVATLRASGYALDSATSCTLTLEGALPVGVAPGYALENLTNTPSVRISRCHFGAGRARGVLLTTPRPAVIEDCVFESPGAQILLAGDSNYWYESGACRDVTIRRNVFTDAGDTCEYQFGGGMISVTPEIPAPDPALPYHGRISICDNLFMANGAPLVKAFSAREIAFTGNTVMPSRAPSARRGEPTFIFDQCAQVDVSDNRFVGCECGEILRR